MDCTSLLRGNAVMVLRHSILLPPHTIYCRFFSQGVSRRSRRQPTGHSRDRSTTRIVRRRLGILPSAWHSSPSPVREAHHLESRSKGADKTCRSCRARGEALGHIRRASCGPSVRTRELPRRPTPGSSPRSSLGSSPAPSPRCSRGVLSRCSLMTPLACHAPRAKEAPRRRHPQPLPRLPGRPSGRLSTAEDVPARSLGKRGRRRRRRRRRRVLRRSGGRRRRHRQGRGRSLGTQRCARSSRKSP